MILFDVLFEVTAGALCAVAARAQLREEPRPLSTAAFRAGLLWSALFYVPGVAFFVWLWPGWSSHYLIDSAQSPTSAAAFAAADVALMPLAYLSGFVATARSIRRGELASVTRALIAAWVGMLLLLFVVLGDRSLAVTTTAAFAQRSWPRFGLPWGDLEGLYGRPIMACLAISCAWNAAPLALIYRALRRRPPSQGSLLMS